MSKLSKSEFVHKWNQRIEAADRVYKAWADRFRVEMLYQYYEGFQWFFETDENNRPYVINMIYSTMETKTPNLLFDNPQFSLRARPVGLSYDEDTANASAQVREDALNFISARPEFGFTDKHELALLDAFFGFGVIESGCSINPAMNQNIPLSGDHSVFDEVYIKQIPFDTFRVSPSANWDLSVGKWYGYFEFIPYERLKKYQAKLSNYQKKPYDDADYVASVDATTGKITVATETNHLIGPPGTCKIWKIWDFEHGRFIMLAPDDAQGSDQLLENEDIEYSPHSFLRFGKRRKGWYPYPPVWNWISPQDELNDTRQAQRLHRKRFSRKYLAIVGAFESDEELDKFENGPDGTICKANRSDAIVAVQDASLDPVSIQSLGITYQDFNRISGTPDEQRGVSQGDRTTATQANIVDQRSKIRDSKDSLNVGNFVCHIARNILRSLRQVKKSFWIQAKLPAVDGLMQQVQQNKTWQKVKPVHLKDTDYDVDLTVTSVSPIGADADKKAFMEFMAVLTQYEVLAFSPALIREAAYRCGYKNEAVLEQFQQFAQLASIGRMVQLQQQAGQGQQATPGTQGIQPSEPGQLPQQQVDSSTPPDAQAIMNMIFNKQGVQQ